MIGFSWPKFSITLTEGLSLFKTYFGQECNFVEFKVPKTGLKRYRFRKSLQKLLLDKFFILSEDRQVQMILDMHDLSQERRLEMEQKQRSRVKGKRRVLGFGMILLSILMPLAERAIGVEEYPSKTITAIHGYAAGGTTDMQARMLFPFVQKHLGQTLMLENLTGADAILATNKVSASPPDGYTLLVANTPTIILQEKYLPEIARYQTRDLTHICSFVREDFTLLSHPEVWKNFPDFIKAAQTKHLRVGIPGKGTPAHLYIVMVEQVTNVRFNIIPFEGGGQLRAALAGKHVDAICTILSGALSMVQSRALNPLIVLSDRRHSALPQTPTLKEVGGLKSFEPILFISGIFGPPKMPAARIKIFEEAFAKALKEPESLDKAKKMGAEIYPLNSQHYLANTERQYPLVEKYIKLFKSET